MNGNASRKRTNHSRKKLWRWKQTDQCFKTVIKNFNPQWFLLCMGTGSLALNLQVLPYQFHGLGIISIVVFILDLMLWLTFITCFMMRCFSNSKATMELFEKEIEATDYLSTLSISASTLIEFMSIVTRIWSGWEIVSMVLFYVDVAFALVASILPYWLMIRFEHVKVDNLPPTVLYPATAILSTASLGSVVCYYTALSVRATLPVFVVSYILLGLGFFLALCVIALYTGRLITAQTPKANKAFTQLVPVAAISNAGYAMVILGRTAGPARSLVASYGQGYVANQFVGDAMYGAGVVFGLLFYGFAIFWIILATIIVAVDQRKADFDLNFWSSLYPVGIFALANGQLAVDFDSPAFRTLTTIFTFLLLFLWLFGMYKTIPGVISGKFLLPAEDVEKAEA